LPVAGVSVSGDLLDPVVKPVYNAQSKMVGDVYSKFRLPLNSTHDLRRLYAAYAYQLYGKHLKEVDFFNRVLGHSSYDVTLMYSNLQISLHEKK